jgi:NAD(P)H-flavin reductase
MQVYPQGLMSQHIAHLKPGDTLAVKGCAINILCWTFVIACTDILAKPFYQ